MVLGEVVEAQSLGKRHLHLLRLYTRGMRNIGVGLIIAIYVAVCVTSSIGPVYRAGNLEFRGVHPPTHFDPMMIAVAILGIALAVGPLRRGERWAALTELMALIMVLVARFNTGAERLVILDPNRHGFAYQMVSILVVGIGLTLTQRKDRGADRPA